MYQEPHIRSSKNFYWHILKPYKWHYLLTLLGVIFLGISPIVNVHYLAQIADVLLQKKFLDHPWQLVRPVIILVVYEILIVLAFAVHDYLLRAVMSGTKVNILQLVYHKVQRYPYHYFGKKPLGELQHQVSALSHSWRAFHEAFAYRIAMPAVTLLAVFCNLLYVSFTTGLLALSLSLVFFFTMLYLYLSPKRSKLLKRQTQAEEGVMTYMTDVFRHMETVFAFRSHRREKSKLYDKTERELKPAIANVYQWETLKIIFGGGMYILMTAVLLGYTTYQAYCGVLSSALWLKIALLTQEVFKVLWRVTYAVSTLTRDWGKTQKHLVLLQGKPRKQARRSALRQLTAPRSAHIIDVQQVSFAHGNGNVLEDFSLQVSHGEKLAIVGASGVGKSTLIKLIMRYFVPQKGKIDIAGLPLAEFSERELADKMVLIPQNAGLFNRSLFENIRYGKPSATLEQVQEAAKKAQIHDYIMGLPQQYHTLAGEDGASLSGGEKQRIAIARAILTQAPILILDEPTSALDTKTERKIEETMHQFFKNKSQTKIVIAHRLSTVKHMDRIIVLDQGKIIESGDHNTLLALNGMYASLWQAQHI